MKEYNPSDEDNIDRLRLHCLRCISSPGGRHILATLELVDPRELAELVLKHWDKLDEETRAMFRKR